MVGGLGQEPPGLVVEPVPVRTAPASPAVSAELDRASFGVRLEAALARYDLLVLVSIVALAAILRLVDLPTRGTWDSDQGHDMLVLRSLVRDGVVPLLGPPTSIGDVHHGAWYYYLLAPAAWLTNASPLGVVTAIALGGVAAVGLTWWIARALGGPIAGAVAGIAMAVSASAIEESTFIWNPNVIALSSAVMIAGAVRAWQTRRARWWLVAGVGLAVTMQAHVLGAVMLPAMVALLLADALRQTGDPGHRRRVVLAGAAWLAILAIAFLPLVVHELTHDFSETRAALAYVRAGGEPAELALPMRIVVVALRIVSWPLTGLITDAFVAAFLAGVAIVAILAWRMTARSAASTERAVARWSAGTLVWTAPALAVAASSLATVTPGLPNDHYHAFLDPIVFVVAGLGAAALARTSVGGVALAVAAVVALVGFNLAIRPPAVAADGGWPAARDAGTRIARVVGDRPIALLSLPDFKSTDGVRFPLVDAGLTVTEPGASGALVIVCDSLFRTAIGADCGGPAEEAFAGRPDRFVALADRFAVSSRTWVSVYLPRR